MKSGVTYLDIIEALEQIRFKLLHFFSGKEFFFANTLVRVAQSKITLESAKTFNGAMFQGKLTSRKL